MAYYLAIQNTYTHVQMALFEDATQRAFVEIDKMHASKECIPFLHALLASNNLSIEQLAFITANQGPGPFTTLRVVIATINGLSYSKKIPLIGVNAIEAFLQESEHFPQTNKVVLLNAFGQDAYYGIQITDNYQETGCAKIDSVLLAIAQKIPEGEILFLGNGADLFKTALENSFANRAAFVSPNPQTVSLAQIAKMGLARWQSQHEIHHQLQPLYFKAAFVNQ